jgi:dihydroneopterin triphosphate diphosphatase
MSAFKIPISVLVILYSSDAEVLLLERADHPGFWQSVTGSLDDEKEPLVAAACREVFEETGLAIAPDAMEDWGFSQNYEIFAHWRHRYAPGVTENTEHVFSSQVSRQSAVRLSAREHLRWKWLSLEDAAEACFSWTNAKAIRELGRRQFAR